jgi:hypothetical protein
MPGTSTSSCAPSARLVRFRAFPAVLPLLLALWVPFPSTAEGGVSSIEYAPLSVGAFSEFGMLQGGRFGTAAPFRDEWVDNFGAYMSQSVSVDDRWFLRVGVGGIFQFQKPEVINAEWGGTQYRNFFAGPTVADIEYELLPYSGWSWRVGAGLFPYKYNPDAVNLGEYLFRSGPYPTYIMTGGYSFVNSASASLQGLKSRFEGGNLTVDVFFVTETVMPPLYDFSLAGVVRYSAFDGLLDVGAGVNFKRLVPVRPSKTTLQDPFHNNAYFKGPDGEYYSGNLAYYRNEADFYSGKLGASTNSQDSAYYQPRAQAARERHNTVRAWMSPDSAQYIDPDYEYYTQSGVIVTAQAAVDLKKLLPALPALGAEDLRLYTEVAVLGVKNYPVFYENRQERMPVMVGFNFPTFGLFDLLALQYEYFASPHPNSYSESITSNGATPEFVAGNDDLLSRRNYRDQLSKGDHSWSVLVRKELTRGLTFSAQAARDHARMVSHAFYAGPGLAPNAMFYTTDKDNWYWMVQLSLGI